MGCLHVQFLMFCLDDRQLQATFVRHFQVEAQKYAMVYKHHQAVKGKAKTSKVSEDIINKARTGLQEIAIVRACGLLLIGMVVGHF